MSLTDTVRRQMLTIAPALKAQMLAAASFTPSSALLPPPSPTKSITSSWNFSPKKRSVRSKSHSRGESFEDNFFDTVPRTLFGGGNELKRPSLSRGDSQEENKPVKNSIFSASLHKTKSSASLATLHRSGADSPSYEADEDPLSVSPRKPLHNRNGSASISFLKSLIPKKSSSSLSADYARQDAMDDDNHDAALQASKFRETSNTNLRVAEVGQLRLRLRGRKTAWVVEFLKHGGYLGMLDRLKEVLELEWREEQKDDQLLHELLRCFEALSLTSVSCSIIHSPSKRSLTRCRRSVEKSRWLLSRLPPLFSSPAFCSPTDDQEISLREKSSSSSSVAFSKFNRKRSLCRSRKSIGLGRSTPSTSIKRRKFRPVATFESQNTSREMKGMRGKGREEAAGSSATQSVAPGAAK